MLRRVLVVLGVLALAVVAGGVAVARGAPTLGSAGPTSVSGTTGTAVFDVADRTIRQVRYDDEGTLRYTFRITNDGRLPVRVLGLAEAPGDTRLLELLDLTSGSVPAGGAEEFTLSVRMTGCETLSARSGSFVSSVRVRTEQAGVFGDTVEVSLPEELHTGSPREAFCPDATATSRPPG